MKCGISRSLLSRLLAGAREARGREICGLLLGYLTEITDAVPIPNVSADPSSAFAFDDAAHLAVSRRLREEGRSVIGCYHSHPSGDASPSATDMAMAWEANHLWLIIAGERAGLWLCRSAGSFEPVELHSFETTALQG
jgi:proteasome lid subunit RPN8/RPN11